MFSLYYNPSVTLSRATSLCTREAFNERFANASPGEAGLAKVFFSGGTLNIGWGGRCTVTNRCSDNLPYGRGCSRIPGGDLLNLQKKRVLFPVRARPLTSENPRRTVLEMRPSANNKNPAAPKKKFPGAGPRAYRICNTVD